MAIVAEAVEHQYIELSSPIRHHHPLHIRPTIGGIQKPAPLSLDVTWAKHLDEVRQAQRLRYDVFSQEMGARIQSSIAKHDIDIFDNFCEHLIVRDSNTQEVVGTYRLLTPSQANRIGSTYTDTEFDLIRLRNIRSRMVELGRSCVHPNYRQGSVIMALWGALAEFMVRNQLDIMIGCASIPMIHQGIFNGDYATSIWNKLKQKYLAPIDLQVTPRYALPLDRFQSNLSIDPPPLIKGYLRIGAKLLGPPAWDPDFNTADLPMMMRLDDMPSRYRKHFLGE
ncbi:MAG: GNAT family N-acetyltransferase [Betaproteobacteria bacterium]|nr:GNAT family N-acetyltransferase [Betaproteobacteria bacterium]